MTAESLRLLLLRLAPMSLWWTAVAVTRADMLRRALPYRYLRNDPDSVMEL